jgi:hypothetical protein
MALTSKRYNNDGTLWSPEKNGENKNLFGDVVHVNGQPWPYLKVEPRKYRLRFLNAAISRSWELYFEPSAKAGTKLNMKVVGSDAGLLTKPVDTTQLDISMAERWEVVFDFSAYKNQNVTLRSNAKVADVDPYLHTDKVMRFVVGDTVSSTDKNDELPAKLRDVNFPPNKVGVDHAFEFQRTGGQWKINGVTWADGPESRVMAKPKRGSVERWSLKNGSGGWVCHTAILFNQRGSHSNLIFSLHRLTRSIFTLSIFRSSAALVPAELDHMSRSVLNSMLSSKFRLTVRSGCPQRRCLAQYKRGGQCYRSLRTLGWSLHGELHCHLISVKQTTLPHHGRPY